MVVMAMNLKLAIGLPSSDVQWRAKGGGRGGGHGPRAQALEGAPAQLVGPNCKKEIRPIGK